MTILLNFSFVFDFNGLVSMFDIFKQFATLQNVLIIHVKHTRMPNQRPQAYKTAYVIKENLIKSVREPDMTF